MNFRGGMKVVCIDAYGADMLTFGGVYTVNKVSYSPQQRWRGKITDGFSLTLYETAPEPKYSGFAGERFKPVDERQTDISIFKEMLVEAVVP